MQFTKNKTKLLDILHSLNSKNIRFIYSYLKQSDDGSCKQVILDLVQGQSIYTSIAKHVDEICKIILQTEKPQSLFIVGQYSHLHRSMKKKLTQSIAYPIALLILSMVSIAFTSTFLSIRFYECICVPIIMICVIIYFMKSCLNKFKEISKTRLVLEFLNNHINFKILLNLFHYLGDKIFITNPKSTSEIICLLLKKNLQNKKQVEDFYKEEVGNFQEFCDNAAKKNSAINLIIVSLWIGWLGFKIIWHTINHLI